MSNNTAEMQAVIETLLFLLAQVESDSPQVKVGESVVIHSDSKYVIELIMHGSRSKLNIVMRDFLSHLWKQTGVAFDMHIRWIRGHTKDIGNEMADKHAGGAADEEGETEVRWRPRD